MRNGTIAQDSIGERYVKLNGPAQGYVFERQDTVSKTGDQKLTSILARNDGDGERNWVTGYKIHHAADRTNYAVHEVIRAAAFERVERVLLAMMEKGRANVQINKSKANQSTEAED